MPINGNTRTFARADRADVEIDLAGALAALDAHGGFQTLSYQEQATYVFDPPATPPAPPTERPHVTPIGGHLAVKPLGSPDPQSRAMYGLTASQVREKAEEIVALLNDAQRGALLTLAEKAPKYRAGIVPTGRFAHPSTATALRSRGLAEWRSFPNKGYKLTDWGNAAVAVLRAR